MTVFFVIVIITKAYTHRILELVNRLGVAHYIKKDLQPYLPAGYYNPLRRPQHH